MKVRPQTIPHQALWERVVCMTLMAVPQAPCEDELGADCTQVNILGGSWVVIRWSNHRHR